MTALGIHGISNFPLFVDCSVLPYVRCMNMGRVARLIFLIGDPEKIKCPVAPVSAMSRLLSIFILAVLNMVSCFGDSILSMEE